MMKTTFKFILLVAFTALGNCHNLPLLSKTMWNFVVNGLSMKDRKKLNMTHSQLNEIRHYEDIKAAVCPKNKEPWGFLKHLQTGQVVVVDKSGEWEAFIGLTNENIKSTQQDYLDTLAQEHYFWLSKSKSFGERTMKFEPKRAEIVPFMRCCLQCFALSETLLEAVKTDQCSLAHLLLDANVKIHKELQVYAKQCGEFEDAKRGTKSYDWNEYEQFLQRSELIDRIRIRQGHLNWNEKMYNGNRFHNAVSQNSVKIVSEYIKAGADKDRKDEDGYTALHLCVSANFSKIAKMLIESGANLDIEDNSGRTALHISAGTNNPKITEMLLNKGALTDVQDTEGSTPLITAISVNSPKIVKMLIDAGANKYLKGKSAFSPLEQSKAHHDRQEISRMLSEENDNVKSKKNFKQKFCCIII